MQKLLVVLAGIAVLALTSPIAAQSGGDKAKTGEKASGATGDMQQRGGGTSQSPQVLASSFTAQITGEVSKIDKQSGKLTLKTPDGPMTVTFPTVAVQHVKQGDRVTVAFGLVESNPAASPATGSSSGSGAGSSGSPAKK